MSILASLAKAYDQLPDKPPYGYSSEKISFVIALNEDGGVANVIDIRGGEGKKKSPRLILAPQPAKKSVNISSNFLWGNTAYVLGVTARDDKKKGRLEQEHAAFVQYHKDALGNRDDAGLKALLRFLGHWSSDQFQMPLWPDDMKDQNVVFALENERRQDIYLHDRPVAKAAWENLNVDDAGDGAVCLITGAHAPVTRLHPSIKGVWGAQSSGASIVSFNLEAFCSYDHEQGDNAPVSELAAFKYTTALNAFLAGTKNRTQIGDASTVFWAEAGDAQIAERAELAFLAMVNEIDETSEAQKIRSILERIRAGVPLEIAAPELSAGVRFHVLGLAPNAARLSIRYWFENDFDVLARNYSRFASDMAIDPPPRDPYPALWKYLAETAVLGKRENVPPNLAGDWMRAILSGTRYPQTLLSTVLMRIRADRDINPLRVAILRALLVRNFGMDPGEKTGKHMEAPVALDPDNRNKGYLLGRLFAVYERAQSVALGPNVNATVKDKFYGAASAQPRKVFPLLDKGAVNHLSKAGKQSPGQRIHLEKLIAGILDVMSPGDDPFPASLGATEQALFSLGYYHQRSEFFRKAETPKSEEAAQ